VWMPVALPLLFMFPGHAGAFHLGQNPIVTMTVLLAGWTLLLAGRPWSGGLVWGLLAFKPVWAVAFLLAPLLMRRWRFTAGMVLGGAALVLATLPFTGVQTWLDWFALGDLGATKYGQVRNWIFLSRDLIDIPRRWMLNYTDSGWVNEEESPLALRATLLGVMLWVSVPLTTALVVWWKRGRPAPLAGPGAAFILLGAFFSCYHFMYYDVMLSVLPLALLFMRPFWLWLWPRILTRRWWPPFPLVVLVVLLLAPPIAFHYTPSYLFPPYDEFALLALWVWCGMRWVFAPNTSTELPTESGSNRSSLVEFSPVAFAPGSPKVQT
jgi:arabinofuranan 3-O-arabinosyltransferase